MSPSNKIIYLEDRSGAELDDKCGMAYWWNRKAGPKKLGIVPKEAALALRIGAETHNDLLTVAKMPSVHRDAVAEMVQEILNGVAEDAKDPTNQGKMELLYRRLGWFVAFALFIEPGIRARYETILVEDELILDRDPLWVAVTPDRILKHRDDGRLEYREYKTTISASQKWLQSWHFALQLHLGLAAASEELEQKINFAQVMGLMKGNLSAADKRLIHPYVWGFYNHQ